MVDSPEIGREGNENYSDSSAADTDGFGPSTVQDDIILELKNLRTYFQTSYGTVKAVDGVSYHVRRGETLGVVGESGSGKSVTALSIMRLIPSPPGYIVGGEVILDGENVLDLSDAAMAKIRGSKVGMILQDPMTALNPVFNIENQVGEAIRIHQGVKGQTLADRIIHSLRQVRIPAAENRMKDFPHQLSGGMRQRVVGAISISCAPIVLIADEPTTALDVTIQAGYLRLLKEIQAETGVGIIFITHDFGIVAKMCDRVAVMYAGRIVETGDVRQIFNEPAHPYSEALLASVPKLEERTQRLYSIEGQPPPLFDLPPGCPFAPRCEFVQDVCREAFPVVSTLGEDHTASCWKIMDYDMSKADPDELAAAQSVSVVAAEEEPEVAEVVAD
ncbi:MAG TPA: ABC transporter ATP-binding protein [Dehalococcoidia bacterium]|nr:dipeptide/oligopeptide/nickel ABC transporter ATP-binding protein [Chloroflexota bacterium]MDP5878193.1 ABC transporter ATP-binding protein [Dehalococcoidia bacterium]MDP7161608.1 ABC transporter ATP-binding protein [Dehalococcoidia bacterium]MDP7214071.1 ABC transporter ATP-binding protein [Dehalococcoidia bacterium]HJM54504.1 ABC transporter ATP-binding protein [Dehalococcoidia bacterium]